MRFEKEWQYVEDLFKSSGYDSFGGGKCANYPFRSRFEHTKRVFKWAERLLADGKVRDKIALFYAVIFHDVGYTVGINKGHAEASARIFEDYAKNLDIGDKKKEYIAYLIRNHERQDLLQKTSKPELIVLMEADKMDEEGAMRIAWDAMAASFQGATSFEEVLTRTKKFYNQSYNPMVTPIAYDIFAEKQRFVKEYITKLMYDLEK